MAIIIEEENKQASVGRILMWLVVLGIIVAAVYYIFFANPEIIDVAAPANLQNIDQLAGLNFNPEDVVNNGAFQSLKQYVSLSSSTAGVGRANPFSIP